MVETFSPEVVSAKCSGGELVSSVDSTEKNKG